MVKSMVLMFLSMVIFFVVHFTYFHFFKLKNRFQVMVVIYFTIAFFYIGLYFSNLGDSIRALVPIPDIYKYPIPMGWDIFFCINGFFYYLFIILAYWEIYFTADRSITIRIMIEVFKSPRKEISVEEFKSIYNFNEAIFDRRFREMVAHGYLTESRGRYRLTFLGAFAVWYNYALIKFLNLEGG